jgi:small GTP-binding protein
MDQLLTRRQAELVAAERTLILRVRDLLAQAEGSHEDVERLARLVNEMDELFLLVVAGEYNAGKSTFINALLGDEVFAMGDLPTTREISILRHGEPGPPKPSGKHTLIYHYPLDVLRDLEIVDTPGTNSLERMEEMVTRDFVPRADLVLFVTSLLQPLTASELDFLGLIRQWGKKVIFVVNGVDRRNSDEQIDRVREYIVREVTKRLGGPEPATWFVSSREALHARLAARDGEGDGRSGGGERGGGGAGVGDNAAAPSDDGDNDGNEAKGDREVGATSAARSDEVALALDPRNEFPALERYLLQTLRENERVRLKLLSPVGVLRKVLEGNLTVLGTRLGVMRDDAHVLGSVREQLDAYTAEMRGDAERYQIELRAVLNEVERRGRTWLENNIRIGNIKLLRNKDAVENRFRNEVVADAPREVEEVVHRMVDWTVKQNLKLWSVIFAELDAHMKRLRDSGALAGHADTEFQYNREELFSRLRQPVEQRLGAFDAEREARGIVQSMRDALTQAFGVNVLAVGLGAVIVTVFTTMAVDVTGILTATLFAIAGWLIIPARRRRLVRELEERIAKLSEDLSSILGAKFDEQLARYRQQLMDVVQPYERFLEVERVKLEQALTELTGARGEVDALEGKIETQLGVG